MDYKVPAHIEIDTYFSTILVSKWHCLNDYMNFKLGISPLSTAPDLYRFFYRSLAIVEKNEAENNIDICEKQTMRDQASKSKALDDIINAITGKRKRDSNDDCENELNKEMVRRTSFFENYATSAREPNNNFAISSFGIEVSSKQILTWDHVVPKMEINENSLKDWINEGHNFSKDFWQFQKSIIEKLKVNPVLSYVTDCESII
ncbi:4971_t:CDS:2 [Funneliformis mosseae]|uniref:4971_t:CDS:1 n=1 Tax=Funneliformis mosseae TaxID=27381 RepID=A0A9N9BTH4_FUNMO|nr:4971_t:CDS:2 [Funneliformis mosseae]